MFWTTTSLCRVILHLVACILLFGLQGHAVDVYLGFGVTSIQRIVQQILAPTQYMEELIMMNSVYARKASMQLA